MDRYKRAYRDPKSPLTPLTPLSTNTAFDFNFGGDNSLKATIDSIKYVSPSAPPTPTPPEKSRRRPKRFSANFLRIRDFFESKRKSSSSVKINISHVDEEAEGDVDYDRTPKPLKQQLQTRQLHYSPYTPTTSSSPHHRLNALRGTKRIGGGGGVQSLKLQKPKEQQHHFKKFSPVPPKPLSPRTSLLLSQAGQEKYRGLFEAEEIDLEVLRLLSPAELERMGVRNEKDRMEIMRAARLSAKIF